MPAIYFLSEGKKTTQDKCIHIQSLQAKIGPSMCQQILVLHAFGGTDTTSAIYGHGKGTLFNSRATNCRCHVLSMIFRTRKLPKSRLVKQDCNCSLRCMVANHQTVFPISGMRHIAIWCQNPWEASTRKVTTD